MERIKTFMAKAKTGGDLGDLIDSAETGTPEPSSADDNELLRRIAAAGHDKAVAILAMSAVDASGERDIHGPFSGLPVDTTAWMLVSCDLGRDCEPNGRLVREKCLTFGQCIGGSYRDYIRYYMTTPYQYEEALKKERQILDLLARGALDELFPLRPKQD